MNSTSIYSLNSLPSNIKGIIYILMFGGAFLAFLLIIGGIWQLWNTYCVKDNNDENIRHHNEYQPIQQEEPQIEPEVILLYNGNTHRIRNNAQYYSLPNQDVPIICT